MGSWKKKEKTVQKWDGRTPCVSSARVSAQARKDKLQRMRWAWSPRGEVLGCARCASHSVNGLKMDYSACDVYAYIYIHTYYNIYLYKNKDVRIIYIHIITWYIIYIYNPKDESRYSISTWVYNSCTKWGAPPSTVFTMRFCGFISSNSHFNG